MYRWPVGESAAVVLWLCQWNRFDLPGHTAGSIGQQSGELVLKMIFLIGLADEVQHRQALFALRQAQAMPQLLEEDGQGLGGT